MWARGKRPKYGSFPPLLPRSPQQVYRGEGWTNWTDFLGNKTRTIREQDAWDDMLQQYSRHVKEHGVGETNQKYAGAKLYHWINTQRQFQRQGRLDPKRKKRLDEEGFVWNPKLKRQA
jgi:hypothetical protein